MSKHLILCVCIMLFSCENGHSREENFTFELTRSYLNFFKSDSLNSILNPIPKILFELKVLNNSKIKQKIRIAETIGERGRFFLTYSLGGEIDTLFNTRYQNFASFDILPGDTLRFDLVLKLSELNIEHAKEMYEMAKEGDLFYISDKVYEIHKSKNFEVIYRDSSSLAIE